MYETAASWLTPSSLFIFVNLVIGTIVITSRFSAPKTQTQHSSPHQLVRSPSLLDRVRSFNYYQHTQSESTHQPQLVRAPSLLERVKSFDFSLYSHQPTHPQTEDVQPESENPNLDDKQQLARAPSLLQRLQSIKVPSLYRSESRHVEKEPEPEPGREEEDEGAVEKRRPETAPARSETRGLREEEEEVDAKADDFINRFKKQLRLQRVDSILRYRQMVQAN